MNASDALHVDLKPVLAPNRLTGLWRLLRGYRLKYLLATLSQGLASLSKTLTYLLLGQFVDQLIAPQGVNLALWMALGFVGLATLEGGFTFLSGNLAAQTAEGSARRLRNYLFNHIQRLSFTYHDRTQTGELIQRSTSDVDAIRRFFADQAIGAGRIVLLFTINFIALFTLHWKLALVSVVIIPLVVITSIYFFKRVSAAYESFQEQEAVLSTTLQENLTGVRVVKAFARQKYESEKFEAQNWEKFLRGRRLLLMHSLYWPASDILCAAQMLGGFIFAALMAINGEISVGNYLSYHGLVVWIIWPIRNLGRLIVQMSTGLVSFQRVADVIKEDEEPLDEGAFQPDGELRGALNFSRVGFAYRDTKQALEDISFEVQPGQIVALLGSTGSGKSTLVNLLPRFYDYTSGSLTLDGVELNQYPRQYLRRQIGIVEQEPFLFSRTIRENIAYGAHREVTLAEIEAAAKAAAIHDNIIKFPNGYDTLVGEKGVTLSGGQKQRVAIARTLLKNPRILIFDDSTSAVDTETEAEIRTALDNLMKNRTTFIIAHRIQSVMIADLILVMDKGQIVQRGRHADLLAEDGLYRRIYEVQTRIEAELQAEITQSTLPPA